jgi:hypothetical protein
LRLSTFLYSPATQALPQTFIEEKQNNPLVILQFVVPQAQSPLLIEAPLIEEQTGKTHDGSDVELPTLIFPDGQFLHVSESQKDPVAGIISVLAVVVHAVLVTVQVIDGELFHEPIPWEVDATKIIFLSPPAGIVNATFFMTSTNRQK